MSDPFGPRLREDWHAWDRPYPLRRVRGFSRRPAGLTRAVDRLQQPEQETDEYGLKWTLYRNYPKRSRYYVSIALAYLRKPRDKSPITLGIGTIPELVVFGGLLRRDYTFNGLTQGSFYFQSEQLGGREVPGGAVVDFLVWIGGEKVGVRVQGKYHALDNPFYVGREKVEEDELQRTKLLARAGFTRLVDVNEAPRYALEKGPDAAVEQEFRRIETGSAR